MEIGFFFWPYDIALVGAMAEAADGFGYDMVGIADTPGNAMDPWVATTLVAARTRRARVAVCVSNLVTRHPAVSAASIASIELLAPGRAVLGIGVGHSGTRNLGAPSLPAAELADGVVFLKELLRARPASYRGGTAHLPWVKRSSPVFLAASHPRSLKAAGAHADGVFINYGLGPEDVKESEGIVAHAARTARPRAGRSAPSSPSSRRTSWAAAISPAGACRPSIAPRSASCVAATAPGPARLTPRSWPSSACSTT